MADDDSNACARDHHKSMTPHPSSWQRLMELSAALHEPEAVRPLFTIVWRSLLTFFLCGLIVVVLYAIMVFTSVVETVNAVPTSTTPQTALDRNALDQTIQKIRERGVLLNIQ